MASARPTKYSQRTMSSVRVGPCAPTASVTGSAGTPTPNVYTPETMCPSFESACQRTVYGPFGRRGSVATISRCDGTARGLPATFFPCSVNTWTAFGNASTVWSNCSTTCRGDTFELLLERRRLLLERRVRERGRGQHERGERGH